MAYQEAAGPVEGRYWRQAVTALGKSLDMRFAATVALNMAGLSRPNLFSLFAMRIDSGSKWTVPRSEHVTTKLGIPERLACRVLGQHCLTQRRTPSGPGDETALRDEFIAVAKLYGKAAASRFMICLTL